MIQNLLINFLNITGILLKMCLLRVGNNRPTVFVVAVFLYIITVFFRLSKCICLLLTLCQVRSCELDFTSSRKH